MTKQRLTVCALVAVGLVVLALTMSASSADDSAPRDINGTLWVANRGADTIRGFDAATGSTVATVNMRPGSQPGDLAYARGKLYVAEEFGTPPAIAVVDPDSGVVLDRIFTGPRPHHVHASVGGKLVAFGVFGSNRIGIIDARTDTLLGEWLASTSPAARSHAGVFSPDGHTVYVANDVVNELAALDPLTGELIWTMSVPAAHELVVTHDGKTAYVSGRAAHVLHVVDLQRREIVRTVALGPMPDTLRLSANEKLLTVGLRGAPAQVAIVDTATFGTDVVTIGAATTVAGHQWTSPSGHFTFAAFEGSGAGVAVIDHEHGNRIVQTLSYPGRPHGVAFVRQ